MVLVHLLQPTKFKTFHEFGTAFFTHVISFYQQPHVSQIHIVFERYDELGIKTVESILRSNDLRTGTMVIENPQTKIPKDIKDLMTNPKNKLELVKFLCLNCFKFVKLRQDQELFISGGFEDISKCYKIQGESMFNVPEITSNHLEGDLEADTRVFVHALYDLKRDSEIVLHSVDTDVFILAIHFWPLLNSKGCSALWFRITNQKSRTLTCHVAANSLKKNVCDVLPALHAFTGCDTTSKIGTKKKGLDLIDDKQWRRALSNLGNGHILSKEEFSEIERLYLHIFKKQGSSADEARSSIFSQSCGIGLKLASIPCTSDALYQHTLRASAQTYIWRNAAFAVYNQLDLLRCGFTQKDGALMPLFMTKTPLPGDLIFPCKCTKSCKKKCVFL
ncbi:hypothetical protein QAD02_014401 [Eretmocerus hayati]|uniref:Uncharacterized protein n=1 Tax=Eretmocerus hayati TaxID=131215 RepID=A0ACC2P5S4_9HYME|nr:hypothetical protein QAD02_014401 [Eretmocerus hayati]